MVRKALTPIAQCAFIVLWCFLGLWTALAALFTLPAPVWLAVAAGVGIAGIFAAAIWRSPFARRLRGDASAAARRPRLAEWAAFATALVVMTAVWVWYYGFVTARKDRDWAPDHALMPIVTIEGDTVRVQNVRNFTWRTATDFTPGYYDRVYDLGALNSMYYVVATIHRFQAVAHVFVCFGFSDGQKVAVSVEARRVKGRGYEILPSMFRQYQLMYVVGDERDVVGVRGAIWGQPVFFYPANTTDDRKRAIFVDMLKRAESLEKAPEFYHLLWNNCMNNITGHLRRLGGRPLPHDLRVLLTGFSDRVAFNFGYIDTDLTFPQARQAFRIDGWMRDTPLDETFSQRLRETIARQVEEARTGAGTAPLTPATSP